MQRLASIVESFNALVGQVSIQRVQEPQRFFIGVSYSSSIFSIINPIKT